MFGVHFLLTDLMSSEYKYFNKIVKAIAVLTFMH